jgi:hypothetical protein
VGGTLGVAVSAFLPWASSGRATRSGFELARIADRLGLADTPLRRALVVAVAFLPALAGAAWTLAVLRRPGWVATLGTVSAAVVLTAAVIVWRAPLQAEAGPWVGAVSGCVALVGAGPLARRARKRER